MISLNTMLAQSKRLDTQTFVDYVQRNHEELSLKEKKRFCMDCQLATNSFKNPAEMLEFKKTHLELYSQDPTKVDSDFQFFLNEYFKVIKAEAKATARKNETKQSKIVKPK